jgi:hypothetical protein
LCKQKLFYFNSNFTCVVYCFNSKMLVLVVNGTAKTKWSGGVTSTPDRGKPRMSEVHMSIVTAPAPVSTLPRFYTVKDKTGLSGLVTVMDRHSGQPRTGKIGAYKARELCKELEATAEPFKIKIAPSFELPPLKPTIAEAPKASPAPRYTTASNGKAGWANVVDGVENRIVGHYYAEIAAECAAKLNAAHEAQPATRPMFPASTVAEPCWTCGANVLTDGNVQPVKCHACNRMAADSALTEVLANAKALRDGAAPFDVLTANERRGQFAALIGCPLGAACCAGQTRCDFSDLPNGDLICLAGAAADEISRRMCSVPEPVREVAVLDDEPLYLLASDGEPSPSERDQIEARIEVAGDLEPVDEYFRDLDVAVGFLPAIEEPVNFRQFAADVCGFHPQSAACCVS